MKANPSGFVAAAATLIFAVCSQAQSAESGSNAVILEWNEILATTLGPGAGGLFGARNYAMMHIAMFDAVNSIEPTYEPYHVRVDANPGASAEAAAAQAAHDVLVALGLPGANTFHAALESRLANIHPSQRAMLGAKVGKKVAQAVVDWRTGDGTEQANLPYTPPALPGLWQPTPPNFLVAGGVQFPNVEPFALLTPTQYLPDPPPLLNSAEYAAAVNEVKQLGRVDSGARTPDQTLQALLFAGSPNYSPFSFTLWNKVARSVVSSRPMSLAATARLFVTMNVAMHDGIQTSHTSKFVYGLWRPVTAVQHADEDHNDATTPDPTWLPLLVTPPYPSHSSNLTCVAVSAARALARELGDDIVFSVTWTGLNGRANETRSYNKLSELATEAGMSRVYGGIHFLFEIEDSVESCVQVADYAHENYMRKL